MSAIDTNTRVQCFTQTCKICADSTTQIPDVHVRMSMVILLNVRVALKLILEPATECC